MVRCHDYLSPKPACNIYRAVFYPYPAASSTSKDEAGNRCMTCAFKRLYDTFLFRPFPEPSTLGSLRFIEHAAVDAFECFSMPCLLRIANLPNIRTVLHKLADLPNIRTLTLYSHNLSPFVQILFHGLLLEDLLVYPYPDILLPLSPLRQGPVADA